MSTSCRTLRKQKLIILFSGKRYTDRERLAATLLAQLGKFVAEIVSLCEPVRKHWTIKMAIAGEELQGPAQVEHFKEMITWSEKVRNQLPTYFCAEALKSATKPIMIVSDITHHIDMDYISNFNIPLVAVRIYASDEKREKRGWVFTEGIDDAPYECDLDEFKDWDFLIDTDCQGNAEAVFQDIKSVVKCVLST